MDSFFTHPQLKTTVSTCKRRRSVVCKALIAWIMTHKLLLPSLPRSLQSCQSRYTHGILILVKDYMYVPVGWKSYAGCGKTLFSLPFRNHCKAVKVDTLMGFWYWSKIICSCWLNSLCLMRKNSLFPTMNTGLPWDHCLASIFQKSGVDIGTTVLPVKNLLWCLWMIINYCNA